MTARRGDVRWGPAPQKSSPSYRPWLVVSDGSAPFADEEAIVVALTTRAHDSGIAVSDEAWIRGGSRRDAHVSPWYVATMKHRDFEDLQGELAEDLVSDVARELHGYVPGSVSE